MSLTKDDLKNIREIVGEEVGKSEGRMKKYVDGSIGSAVEKSEKKIIAVISREINDLAEINQAVIDKIDNHDIRITRVEHKLGLVKV